MAWIAAHLRRWGAPAKSAIASERGTDRDHSRRGRSAGDPASWPPIIEVSLHRANVGNWRGTVRKQKRSPIRAILIVVVTTAAFLGALLFILWIDATSTGTVPL